MVIKHAKELLKTTPLSIKEVSNQLKICGFFSFFVAISDAVPVLPPALTEKII